MKFKKKNKRMDILEAKGMKKHWRTIVSVRSRYLKKGIKKESKGKEKEKKWPQKNPKEEQTISA